MDTIFNPMQFLLNQDWTEDQKEEFLKEAQEYYDKLKKEDDEWTQKQSS